MKKLIISVFLGILLVLTLVGCGDNSSEIITLSNEEIQKEKADFESASNVYVYQTQKLKEYLAFMENFDESSNEIIGISTSMYTTTYGSGEFYMVTYKKLDTPIDVKKNTGKVSLFRTTNVNQYCSFLANIDKRRYEILGTTTSMYTTTYGNGTFYMVTIREIKK